MAGTNAANRATPGVLRRRSHRYPTATPTTENGTVSSLMGSHGLIPIKAANARMLGYPGGYCVCGSGTGLWMLRYAPRSTSERDSAT